MAAAIAQRNQPLLRAIMTRLVTPEGTRSVVPVDELMTLAADQRDVQSILDQLVNARLVHLQQDADQGAIVEIVHEMLITEWPMLKRWLEDSHALRGFLQELRQAARQWTARGKPADLVWRGAHAQDALGLAKRNVLDLSRVEREFLDAIAHQAARTRRRRLVVIASIVAVVAVVLSGGAVATIRIKMAEQDARDKALAAQTALAEARDTKADLQKQFDVIKEKEAARDRAERERESAVRAADQASSSERMTKGELEVANKALRLRVAEAQAAKEKAMAATQAAKAANERTETLLARERAARAKAEERRKGIYDKVLK
jgi:hypothetical protein